METTVSARPNRTVQRRARAVAAEQSISYQSALELVLAQAPADQTPQVTPSRPEHGPTPWQETPVAAELREYGFVEYDYAGPAWDGSSRPL